MDRKDVFEQVNTTLEALEFVEGLGHRVLDSNAVPIGGGEFEFVVSCRDCGREWAFVFCNNARPDVNCSGLGAFYGRLEACDTVAL